jgi:phosphoserine phosphatase
VRWKLACFDLDGTLVTPVSTGQHVAARLGHLEAMREIEQRYAAGLATNADVAALDGQHYAGLTKADVSRLLDDIPVINDIAATVDRLNALGTPSVLCTLAWRFVGDVFAERYGFIASSGPTLGIDRDGRFTGEVASDFSEYDKPAFVGSLCQSRGIRLSEVFHVGDSRSDVPLFEAVGYSVALNASQQARDNASIALESDSLLDVLRVIPGLSAG